MSEETSSVFSKIVSREIPADIVRETDRLIAFRDIQPQAPTHVLVVPKTGQYAQVSELAAGDPELLAQMVGLAQDIADELCEGQFRLVFNSGEKAGQTVFHVHAHILGGNLAEGSLAER
jgi:histidine triad (HIT) family protein